MGSYRSLLEEPDSKVLAKAHSMQWAGGIAPRSYQEWRQFERLRKARHLKYFDRKRARWDRTFYTIPLA